MCKQILNVLFGVFGLILVVRPVTVQSEVKCPKSRGEWIRFHDKYALKIVKKSQGDDAHFQAAPTVREVNRIFENCYNENQSPILGDSELQSLLMNLRRFAWTRRNEGLEGWAMGFNVPDAQYFQETSAFSAVPKDLQSPKLLAAFRDPKRIDEALQMLADLNKTYPADRQLVYFKYTSQHLTTPDASAVYGRVLVYVPRDEGGVWRA